MKNIFLFFFFLIFSFKVFAQKFPVSKITLGDKQENWYKTFDNGKLNYDKCTGSYYNVFYLDKKGKKKNILRVRQDLWSAFCRKYSEADEGAGFLEINIKGSVLNSVKQLDLVRADYFNAPKNALVLRSKEYELKMRFVDVVFKNRKRKLWEIYYTKKSKEQTTMATGKSASQEAMLAPIEINTLCYVKPKALSSARKIVHALNKNNYTVVFSSELLTDESKLHTKDFWKAFSIVN